MCEWVISVHFVVRCTLKSTVTFTKRTAKMVFFLFFFLVMNLSATVSIQLSGKESFNTSQFGRKSPCSANLSETDLHKKF